MIEEYTRPFSKENKENQMEIMNEEEKHSPQLIRKETKVLVENLNFQRQGTLKFPPENNQKPAENIFMQSILQPEENEIIEEIPEKAINFEEFKEGINLDRIAVKQEDILLLKNRPEGCLEIEEPNYRGRELIISPTEGTQNTFYCIKEDGGKIGRHSSNHMVILEESVSRFHAEILFCSQSENFYLKDIGSTTGTFLKIPGKISLEVGMILEMGSNQFVVEACLVDEQINELRLNIFEGPNLGQVYKINLKNNLSSSSYSIGRKATNQISFPEDHHLSNIHSKIYMIDNKFILEDLGSTNGYLSLI